MSPPVLPPEGFHDRIFCEYEPRSQEAWEKSGLHPHFIKPILDVATIYNTIIMIRANDPNYIELITDRYTTKSMVVHSKTCSWGPMTGFVCLNPVFHKKPTSDPNQRDYQLTGLAESLSHPKEYHRINSVSPLRITERRFQELVTKNIIQIVRHVRSSTEMYYVTAREPIGGRAFLHGQHEFLLKKQHVMGQPLWRVQYAGVYKNPLQILEDCRRAVLTKPFFASRLSDLNEGISVLQNKLRAYQTAGQIEPQDVLILVDPRSPYSEMDYRCATIGDYDLLAIHPLLAHFAAQISALAPEHSHAYQERQDVHPLPPWIFNPASTKIYQRASTPSDEVLRWRMRTALHRAGPLEDTPSGRLDVVGIASSPPRGEESRERAIPPAAMLSEAHAAAHNPSPATSSPSTTSSSPLFSPALQGAMSNREMDLINELNNRVKYGGDDLQLRTLRLFHHGPDSRNPHGHKPDLPCTALIPCAMHSDESGARCFRAVYIDSAEKLEDFHFWNVICAGYALFPGINPKWFAESPQEVQAISVCDPVTDQHTHSVLRLAHRTFLNAHIKFEELLVSHHAVLLATSARIWLNSIPRDVRTRIEEPHTPPRRR